MRKCIREQHILWCNTCSMGGLALMFESMIAGSVKESVCCPL